MADFKVTQRDTETQQNKGQISTQTYTGETVRTATSTPANYVETRIQQGVLERSTSSTKGDVRETRTTEGIGKTVVTTEDKGLQITFKLILQNRNPINRSA